jgi:proline racemase
MEKTITIKLELEDAGDLMLVIEQYGDELYCIFNIENKGIALKQIELGELVLELERIADIMADMQKQI